MCLAPITIVNPRYKGKSYLENRAYCELGKIGALPYQDFTLSVPCGRCPECLSRRRVDYSFRVIYEMERSYSPVFVTLTYSNEYLPAGANLSKDDAKRFLKYCANHLPFKYKYYLCGEYGEEHGRPHYHVCLMPSEPPLSGFNWDSFLSAAWFDGCIIDVLPLNSERCAYCCKYSVKQLGMNYDGRERPFALFSKSLGIGFVEQYGDAIKHNGEPLFNGQPISRYYAQKLFSPSFLRIYNDRKRLEYLKEFDSFDYPDRIRDLSQINKSINTYAKTEKAVLRKKK